MSSAVVLVERATSDMLIGPDWSINMELCDVLNRDLGQAKRVMKHLKKRLNRRQSKVQLLTLALLETMIKNCGDVVHFNVAEKGILHEMVKIVKNRPDFHVKEKILVLIDTWQEAFGGPRAKYPQYYAAYRELLCAGAVFPQRLESSVPVFTPPQTQPLSSNPPLARKPESELRNEAPESSARSDLPSLSMSEIRNARSIMDVLSEMLSAMDPANREGLKQEVVVDLVEQCSSYKQRAVQLVNTTSDEALLSQGLALNDDLQRVLVLRDAIASGIAIKVEKPKPVANSSKVDAEAPNADAQPNSQISTASSNSTVLDSTIKSPPSETSTSSGSTSPPAMAPLIDLLSGDFNPPEDESPLAIVPVSINSSNSTSDQNALALSNAFPVNAGFDRQPPSSFNSHSSHPTSQMYTPIPNTQVTQQKLDMHSSFNGANSSLPQMEQSHYVQGNVMDKVSGPWSTQGFNMQSPQPHSFDGGNDQGGGVLPLPPWEMQQNGGFQPEVAQLQHAQGTQMRGIYPQQMPQNPQYAGGYYPTPNAQMIITIPYPIQGGPLPGSQIQAAQMTGGSYMHQGWAVPPADAQYYGQASSQYPYPYPQPTVNDLSQRMYGMHMQGNGPANTNASYQTKQPARLSRPEDRFFGDLVDFAKSNPSKAAN